MLLNGDIVEQIFVRHPKDFTNKNHSNLAKRKLEKRLYGLKQFARCWYKSTDEFLKELGYTKNDTDPCICHKRFIKDKKECILIIAVYFDDLLIASNDMHTLQKEKKRLGERFEIEGKCEVHYILRIRIMWNQEEYLRSTKMPFFLLCSKDLAWKIANEWLLHWARSKFWKTQWQ